MMPLAKRISSIESQKAREALEQIFITNVVTPGTIFTNTPTGNPNVERLIHGKKDPWQVEGGARRQGTLKHIVISDFTLGLDKSLQQQIADYIPQEGDTYRLFIVQRDSQGKDNVVEIKSPEDLKSIDYSKIPPLTTEQVNKLVYDAFKISSEQAAILGLDKFREAHDLLNNTDSYIYIDSLQSIPNISTFLKESKITNLKITVWNAQKKPIDTEALKGRVRSLKLQLQGPDIPEKLKELLQQNQQIENVNLNLRSSKQPQSIIDLLQKPYNLKRINLSYTDILAQDLAFLLQKAPNVKQINLSGCNKIGGFANNQGVDKIKLDHLEEIDFSKTNISQQDLVFLLKNAFNLKKLNLIECKNIIGFTEYLDPNTIKLEYLEYISLLSADISEQDTIFLYKKTINQ